MAVIPFVNIEIKARTSKTAAIRQFLLENGADFKGTDYQADTYFITGIGRLKLRQGNIENNLIWYERDDQPGPKQSSFQLVAIQDAEGLKSILAKTMGIKVVVAKKREIYFIGNVKFHLDELENLGSFVEIEASNKTIDLPLEKLREQCNYYLTAFNIQEKDLVFNSYSDMMLATFS
jgi:adenylate cyclase class 2